jgi:16S rRNA (cytidine1402-2'-O)-methyltransferase
MQKTFKDQKPTLYVVATPIGHLKDFSARAIETLKHVSVIYAEDTRTSAKLLSHYDIKTPVVSYHEYNKEARAENILKTLHSGVDIALISDAGTPGISDPGYEMINLVIDHGHQVTTIPGASAMLSALVVSGLPTDQFTFIGFLPKKASDLKDKLESVKYYRHTLIIYESPKRIQKTIEVLYTHLGNRKVVLARELTKLHESILRTTLKDAKEIEHDERGEYVIVLEGAKKETHEDMDVNQLVRYFVSLGHDEKEAMKLCAKHKNMTKSEVYKVYKIGQQKS